MVATSSATTNTNRQYVKGSGWFHTNQRVAVLEEHVALLKNWYDAEMAKLLAKRQEEEWLQKMQEEEERRLKEKQERERFQKELSDEWHAKFESACGALRSNSNRVDHELEKLKKQIEDLKISQRQGTSGASTSNPAIGNDALLARVLQEHEDLKSRFSLEVELRTLKQSREEALQEVETWKNEALKSGNKRSRLATSPSSGLKMPPTITPAPRKERSGADASKLQQLHNLEVDALKGLRLQEMNWRREAEQENERLKERRAKVERENAKLKEELAARDKVKRTPVSSFRERLDEADTAVGGTSSKTTKKKRGVGGNDDGRDNDCDAFLREARKEFCNLKKDDVMEICMKEGVKYTTLTETVAEIISKRADRAFGKKAVVEEISDDHSDDVQADGKSDGRDSGTS
ncbi:hypothetical protein CBR_g30571 [Chara braunii]|uniref:Uncharacterized protein n=1 Tax=Chara braunii TaxID=69332 RepID=A0A388LD19_CHABU|nr:hypothetical protein CBR_g30571 [Chara braunii]|eukprot:GBG80205.1 hypothetical protein CBR_g30571 [Chara braunii]